MILKTIIDRLNQRIEVSNIFDRIYGLCELTGDKGWIYYIGDGQAIPVTDYDSKQGSLFWAKRGKVNISKIDSLKVSGCKQMYSTKFNLSAYAIVRKSHLPCDGEDAGDWVASRVYKLVSGRDYGFKEVIDVVSYEVIPNGYTVGDKTLPPNFEFATVVIDLEVEIVSGSEDTCYDICNTGDIPLPPDFLPCTPCLTEVAVDGVTIIGNGTPADPLVVIGGGGGDQDLQSVTDFGNSTTNDIDFIGNAGLAFDNGAGFRKGTTDAGLGGAKGTAQICSISYELKWEAGRLYYMEQDGFTIREVTHNFNNVPQPTDDQSKGFIVGSRWVLDNGDVYVCSDDTIGAAVWVLQIVGSVTSVSATVPSPTNPAYSVNVPNPNTTPSVDITANGTVSQYVRGDGSLANFPFSGGGGASVNYYLNGSVNQGTFGGVTYYEMSRTPIIGGGTQFSIATNGYIASFITDAGDPNLLNIPAGNWNFETYFSASSGGGNPNFYLELYKYDGANFTLIASNSSNPEGITGGTVTDLYVSALAVPQTTLLATDRLAVRVFVNNSGRTITLHTENNSLCQIITTFTTGLTALNGLTEQVQNFATGTSGTDFNINSATSTHTFNLPTASATNRGALSSSDWSTFNGKQNALGFTPEDVANKSTSTTLGTSNTLYPSQLAVKSYVDNEVQDATVGTDLYLFYNY